jgi:FtsH-binding integral membrane protein
MLALGMGGIGVAGLTFLSYKGATMKRNMPPEMQLTMFDPLVQQRIQSTFGSFSAACMATGGFVHMFRNSQRALTMNPWLLLGLSFGSLIGTQMIDYHANYPLKCLMYGGFVSTMSLSLLPLIHMSAPAVVFDALIATGVTVGGLGMVAYNSPSEQFLNWGGPLALGLGGMLGVSLLSIVYPGSPALRNIWLYGGLALFSAFMLYDTQMIINRAKTSKRYDPINESIHIYMDAINLFIRFLMIFGGNKK